MRIVLANPRGFCAGVNMASQCVEEAVKIVGNREPISKPVLLKSGMALLILWKVDHRRPFPAGVEITNRIGVLLRFCQRLRKWVLEDDELKAWLVMKEMQVQLAPGLRDSHHLH